MDILPKREDAQIKRICIIGAGAAGLAALKIIIDTRQYKAGLWKPVVFEARDNVGGIWLPAPSTQDLPLTSVYDSLTTNVPHPVMAFTSFPFPPSTPLYPPASTVQTYLESYTAHFELTSHIRFNTLVQAVHREFDPHKWKVQISSGDLLHFDLVIVANGHHSVPRYPDIPGLSRWIGLGKASHSAWYRRPSDFGEVVLVIGGGPSGQDISAEMCTAARTIIHSVTGGVPTEIGNMKKRGRVAEFKDGGEVVFEDGLTECGVDHCIIATGYDISFPFLTTSIIHSGFPPVYPLPQEIYNSGYHVFPLAKHIFPLQSDFPPSSIAFLGLLRRVLPFPLVEAQTRAVIKAFEDPGSLDTTRDQDIMDITTRYEEIRSTFGDDRVSIAKNWHTFNKKGEQFEYRDRLDEFAEDDPGARVVVAEWEKEMYEKKNALRGIWRELERTGEADEWVQGVGEDGTDEWVDMTRRLLKRAEENASVPGTSML